MCQRRRRSRFVVLSALVALGVAFMPACGDDDDGGRGAEGAGGATTSSGAATGSGSGEHGGPAGAAGTTATAGTGGQGGSGQPGGGQTGSPSSPGGPATATTRPGQTGTTTGGPSAGLAVGLWVVDLDGPGRRRVGNAGLAAWSPDGRWLAVATATGIDILSAADGQLRSTVRAPSLGNFCLDWSTGDQLAWVGYSGDVWMASPNDRDATRVDRGRLPPGFATTSGQLCRWSPDGSVLVVGGSGLRIYAPDGTEVSTQAPVPDARSVDYVAWAPDGSAVAAIEQTTTPEVSRILVKARAAELRSIPSPGGPVRRLAWPTDSSGLYVRTSPGRSEDPAGALYAVDLKTGAKTLLARQCCGAAFVALPGPRYLGIVSGERTADTMVVFGPDYARQRDVAHADNAGACGGSYFLHARVSPGHDRVAVTAPTKTGQGCDYPGPF